jgi:DNA-binding NarL/FixJ family response regulator
MERQSTPPVVLIEDQAIFRQGLRLLLEDAGFAIAGEFSNISDALADLDDGRDVQPNAVILFPLRQCGWQEFLRRVRLNAPTSTVLGILEAPDKFVIAEALGRGVAGCLERSLSGDAWTDAMRKAYAGILPPSQTVLTYPMIATQILLDLAVATSSSGIEDIAPVIAPRERAVLLALSELMPLAAVAENTGLSKEAVCAALDSVCGKFANRQHILDVLFHA